MADKKTSWLSRGQAAECAQVSIRTVDRWLARGLLKKRVSRANRVEIEKRELERFLNPRTPNEN